jgi:acyl dehydratase
MKVAEEKKKTPEEILEEARTWIGRESETVTDQFPRDIESIRRYCMMVDDDNPLYQDPEYAKKTKWGGVIMPPFGAFGIISRGSPELAMSILEGRAGGIYSNMPPTPGKNIINLAQELENYKPIYEGDTLTVRNRIADVYIKPIKMDPKAFWVVGELIYTNQKGEQVCILRNISVSHRTPDEVAADSE